ncbi:MAG: hypothetical protein WA705_28765 [Candidatus Ozemobacteraceae bacterium]
MNRKRSLFFGSLFVSFLFATAAFAEPNVGKLLEDAMKSRNTGTVEEVSAKFYAAVESTSNPDQKSVILSLLSDYFLDHREWDKVITLHQQILKQGNPKNRAGSLYNIILANVELNQMENARSACVEFRGCPSGASRLEFAQNMNKISPNSIHGRIGGLLAATPVASKPLEAPMCPPAEENASLPPVASPQTLEPFPAQPEKSTDASVQVLSPTTRDPQPENAEPGASLEAASKTAPEATQTNRPSKHIEIQVGGWNNRLDGNIVSKGMSLGLNSDVSTKSETSPTISAVVVLTPKDRIKASYVDLSHTGSLNKAVVYDKKPYSPGASVKMETSLVDVEGFRELKKSSKTILGLLYGVTFTNSTFEMAQYLAGNRQVGNYYNEFAFPYLGLAMTSQLGKYIGFNASIKGLAWGGDDQIHNHDLELKFLFGRDYAKNPSNAEWYGFLGYRDFRLSTSFENESDEIGYSGPIFGFECRF